MSLKNLTKLAEDTKNLTNREMSLSRRIFCLGSFLGVLLGIVITTTFSLIIGGRI